MRIMSGQDRSAAAAHETINLLHKVRTVAVQSENRGGAADAGQGLPNAD
jgi:hypothetical protein